MITPASFIDYLIPVFPDSRSGFIDALLGGVAIPMKSDFRLFLGFYDQTGAFLGIPGNAYAHAKINGTVYHGSITTRAEADFLGGLPHAIIEAPSTLLVSAGQIKISIWKDDNAGTAADPSVIKSAMIKVFDSGMS